jgi:hypothetical protein
MDGERFARNIESAFRTAWTRYAQAASSAPVAH